MWWIVAWFAIFFCMQMYDYYLLRGSTGKRRCIAVCLLVIAAFGWPFVAPAHLSIVRFLFGMAAFNKIIKSIEIAYERVYDPNMLASFGRYLIWSCNFPDTIWAKTKLDREEIRRKGRKRLMRALGKTVVIFIILTFLTVVPCFFEDNYYASMLLLAFAAYFLFSGFSDMYNGLFMQTGIDVIEMFDNPLMARSPREFWGRRWNLYFRDVCHRNVFLPLGGKKRALVAVFAVFLISALLHEYLIFVSLGFKMLGCMTVFFMLHCIATFTQTAMISMTGKKELMPRWLAILLHNTWLVVTFPFLAEPILQIIPFLSWRLW